MAKTSSVEKNNRRRKTVQRLAAKRKALKAVIMNQDLPMEERFRAQLKLAALPRNSSAVRIRNRCLLSGRPRGYNRKFGVSRIQFRELALAGKIPGVVKSSW